MIPVFQTRYAVETFGNCLEACIASILEVPLSVIPDRAAQVDLDAWADLVSRTRFARGERAVGDLELPASYELGEEDLRAWLLERGIGWLDLDQVHDQAEALDVMGQMGGYWIAHTRQSRAATSHATVWLGRELVHNPSRKAADLDAKALGPIHAITLLVASRPAATVELLGPELLPAVPLQAAG